MKGVRRSISIFLVFLLVAGSLGGCGGDSTAETTMVETTASGDQTARALKLPYFKNEPLHPFKAASMVNIQLAALLYDGLFTLGADYTPEPVIAAGYVTDDLTITVTVKSGLVFADGTPLTPDDVIYSFNQAKAAPAYAARLANFGSAKKDGANGIVFALRTASPYAVNCLTYPVIKNSDKAEPPVSSGRYTVQERKGKLILLANTSRSGGFSPRIKSITLAEITETANLNYSLQIGNVDFAYTDLSSGSYQRINATAIEVGLNNFVYLGLNSYTAKLKDPAVRQAISLLIDKKSIAGTAFQNHARAAFTPFNPDFAGSSDDVFERDLTGAVELLKQAGYVTVKNSGVRYSRSTGTLTFNLVVNSDNPFKTAAAELIAQQLSDAGMKVNISALAFDAYLSAIQSGKFDMYLGEILLTPDMAMTPLLTPGGSAAYGINNVAGQTSAAYGLFISGAADLKGFIEVFAADLPFIPLCYRNGIAMYTRDLKVPQECRAGDVFCDIQAWSF